MKGRSALRALVLGVVGAVVLTACGPGTGTSTSGGKHLTVLATWGGDEQKSFLAMVKPWEDKTGNKIDYTGSRDLNQLLVTRTQAGNPPDLAGLPGPGFMAEFAKKGTLKPLDSAVDMTQMKDQYDSSWIKLGSVNGKLYGIFIKASLKSQIWYDPKVVAGAGIALSSSAAPTTFDQLTAVTGVLAAAGKTPWCIGVESGAASGWPGADWLQDIYMRQAGPSMYEQWGAMTLPWTDPTVKTAFQTWGKIVNDPKQTYGGKNYVLSTAFQHAFDPMFKSPPGCYLHHQASFITSFFQGDFPDTKPVDDFNFFGFPDINSQYSGVQQVAGDLFGMFKDSPEARDFIKYLTTAEAQSIWVKRGGAVSPNKKVNLSDYPDPLSKAAGQILTSAKPAEFSADDLMSGAMSAAMFKGIVDYISNPSQLDTILGNLEKTRTGG
jgi:alpha-glucoside transport system substrate-binding protein